VVSSTAVYNPADEWDTAEKGMMVRAEAEFGSGYPVRMVGGFVKFKET
jgi:hypothetical protein